MNDNSFYHTETIGKFTFQVTFMLSKIRIEFLAEQVIEKVSGGCLFLVIFSTSRPFHRCNISFLVTTRPKFSHLFYSSDFLRV